MQTAFELPDSILSQPLAIVIPEKGLFGTDSARVIPASIFTDGRKKLAPELVAQPSTPTQEPKAKPAPAPKPKAKRKVPKAKPASALKPAPKPAPMTGFKVN